MRGAIPTLAGFVTVTALVVAAPAALASPHAHGTGKAAHRKAAHRAAHATSAKLNAGLYCAAEYEYVFAGAQCAVPDDLSASDLTAAPVSVPSAVSAPTSKSCPGEYEYIYSGAQCAPSSAPALIIPGAPVAAAATAKAKECSLEYDYVYSGTCEIHN